jgi:hypothetical protein
VCAVVPLPCWLLAAWFAALQSVVVIHDTGPSHHFAKSFYFQRHLPCLEPTKTYRHVLPTPDGASGLRKCCTPGEAEGQGLSGGKWRVGHHRM